MSDQLIIEKIEGLEAILLKMSSRDAEIEALKAELAEEREFTDSDSRSWDRFRENAVKAALEAYEMLRETQMHPTRTHEERIELSRKISDWLVFCREHVWADHEDPHYDPNQCGCA